LEPQKGTSLHEIVSYEPSCVKINSVVFLVEDGKKKREGKRREGTKSKHYISPIHGEPPVNGFSPNSAHQEICWT